MGGGGANTIPVSESRVTLAVWTPGTTALTTSRMVSNACAVDTAELNAVGSALTIDMVSSTVHAPPCRLPSSVAFCTSDCSVTKPGSNGSGKPSCTHSPSTPLLDTAGVPTYEPLPELYDALDIHDCARLCPKAIQAKVLLELAVEL